MDPKLGDCCTRPLGPELLADHDNPAIWEQVEDIRDAELWDIHLRKKIKLIGAIRERIRRRWLEEHVGLGNVVAGGTMLNPTILTIGFGNTVILAGSS
jgi:glycogen phosphorylase